MAEAAGGYRDGPAPMVMVYDLVLPIALAVMMFSLGLALRLDDFARIVRHPKALLVALPCLLVIVPAIGVGVAHLSGVAPALAVGIYLVATCPGGTLSNLLTFWGRGDLALSISMTAAGSVAYSVLAPLWLTIGYAIFMGGIERVSISPLEAIIPVARISLLPVVLGMLVRAYLPRVRDAIEAPLRHVAAVVIIAIFLLLMWQQRETFVEAVARVWPAVLALNLLMVGTGFLFARLFSVARAERTAIVCEHAIRQEGLAIFIVTSLLAQPAMALPLILNSATGFAVGMAYIGVERFLAGRAVRGPRAQLSSFKGPN
ncbi:bile acid:sodium symporter family protein [Sphingosinicella sp.]|uniref:bile acid:sodium symporter family protein n=1 Tax=Sphingosinicella sp. TaxID=1917971 RepID=UPI0017DCCC14|nr:bile acid:sodium symporter family protein [Sphingosinicella sp.]MBA4760128.1 bile acid:sodium symporter family protein [Sphingosinicella sp.]